MKDDLRGKCGSCAWGKFHTGSVHGSCVKHPPVVVVLDGEPATEWPAVMTVHWCGQYSPRRDAPWTFQTAETNP